MGCAWLVVAVSASVGASHLPHRLHKRCALRRGVEPLAVVARALLKHQPRRRVGPVAGAEVAGHPRLTLGNRGGGRSVKQAVGGRDNDPSLGEVLPLGVDVLLEVLDIGQVPLPALEELHLIDREALREPLLHHRGEHLLPRLALPEPVGIRQPEERRAIAVGQVALAGLHLQETMAVDGQGASIRHTLKGSPLRLKPAVHHIATRLVAPRAHRGRRKPDFPGLSPIPEAGTHEALPLWPQKHRPYLGFGGALALGREGQLPTAPLLDREGAHTTALRSVPIPSMVTSTKSPTASGPTPAGVPVAMTSPGSSANQRER